MKKLLFPLLLGFLLGSCATTAPSGTSRDLPVVPRPLSELVTGDRISFGPKVAVLAAGPWEPSAQEYAAALKGLPGLTVNLGETADADTVVRLQEAGTGGTSGSYRLAVSQAHDQGPSMVEVEAQDADGFYYGLQTLAQMVRAAKDSPRSLPVAEVTDAPRYLWRGSMLDSARHFIPVDYIKRHLSLMAELKLNLFHWHLTDDQGWRFEVPGYPKLTSIGAWRSKSGPNSNEPGVPLNDKGQYGGFYTDDQIRDIVAYAATLHIAVLPEVDMPGHNGAAVASYPDLGCKPGNWTPALAEPLSGWGVFPYTLNPAAETTFTFVEAVVKKLTVLFPYPFIHIGGDEVSDIRDWSGDPVCQQVMVREKLDDTRDLEGYFHKRVAGILAAAHRTPVGWEDVINAYTDQNIKPPTVLQFWSQPDNLQQGLGRGHKFIFSPYFSAYLDMTYAPPEPKLWGGYVSLEEAYGLDPTRWTKKIDQILGVEGELWTERTPTPQAMDDKIWPRLAAIAEDGWTSETRKDWGNFAGRMAVYGRHLADLGVRFNRCDGVDWGAP